ncbi:MAG: hypothetical protein LBI31_03760, partial [Zoogloeaceae bacterium]|nr:hypothetical protein [Zoogloeaceae bacterium]
MKVSNPTVSARWQEAAAIQEKAKSKLSTWDKDLRTMYAKFQENAKKTAGSGNSKRGVGVNAKDDQAAIAKKRRQEQYKRELRNCRTKEEVEAVRRRWQMMFAAEISAIKSANMPSAQKEQAVEAARQRYEEKEEVYREFQKSANFHSLPDKEDEKEKKQGKRSDDATQSILEAQAEAQNQEFEA